MPTHLSTKGITNVSIVISLNGKSVELESGYILGVLKSGDKIIIGIEVAGGIEHSCYTLSSKNSEIVRTPKKAVKPGNYLKSLTVTDFYSPDGTRSTQIAGWPNNILCLEVGGQTFNIGIFNRNGKYFFANAEREYPIETNSALPIGLVTYFDVLRGVARIYNGNVLQDAKLHWSNMPFRKNLGFRAVVPGEVLTLKAIVETGAEQTSFSQEVKSCSLA